MPRLSCFVKINYNIVRHFRGILWILNVLLKVLGRTDLLKNS